MDHVANSGTGPRCHSTLNTLLFAYPGHFYEAHFPSQTIHTEAHTLMPWPHHNSFRSPKRTHIVPQRTVRACIS
jgi:hypothetical protein